MTTYNFSVLHGDTIIPVTVDVDGDIDDAAMQAAASAQLMMKPKPFVVSTAAGHVGTFTPDEIDEWWA